MLSYYSPGHRLAVAAFFIAGFSCAAAAQDAIVTFKSLAPDVAVEAAQAALASCRDEGFQIAVSVVDRGGNLQATIRDQFAGPHTPDTSYRKAWTAVSFRTDTLELAELTEEGEAWAIRNISNALPLGGGVQIVAGDGSMLGAIGVSGAPSGSADKACADAGLAAIDDKIAF
ncbi:GlcG/HbpS family heme-binding protein [Denitrobaculum tricleocarpae]|uniref:Heme-binding protein n=1 Tax=Denitrobaculum tricleocarpae TaxID=2591009 RepID=A0A545TMZ7_9PROT|nr:heme-binding protein [Denitrobaculum tricleocarpae]TQV78602.1 heme-binding protein [Denitrobaculum tricleocarpae]